MALLTFAALWPVVTHQFIEWDDPHNVWANPDLDPPTWQSLARYWSRPYQGLYVPLTYTLWAGLSLIAHGPTGPDPHVFHTANLLIHLGTSILVFFILNMLVRDSWPSAIGAMIFATHPVQVETVAWVSGMKDLLCGLLSMTAIHQYMHGRRVWASLAFVLALLSKPTAVVVPVICGVIDVSLLNKPIRRTMPLLATWLAISAAAIALARIAQPASEAAELAPIWARPLIALDAMAFYLRQIVFPWRLCLDYGRSPDRLLASAAAYLTWTIPAALAIALIAIRKQAIVLPTAGMIFALGVLPVLGIVPFDFQIYSTVADHYLYLAMLGPALAIAWMIHSLRIKHRQAIWVGVTLAALLAGRSWIQSWVWRDSISVFEHNLKINPQSWASHINLSADALRRGDAAAAEKHARAALRFRPNDGRLHSNLGIALGMTGKLDEAAEEFGLAIRLAPDDPAARVGLGQVLVSQGKFDQAIEQFDAALKLDPTHLTARFARQKAIRQRTQTPASSPSTRMQ